MNDNRTKTNLGQEKKARLHFFGQNYEFKIFLAIKSSQMATAVGLIYVKAFYSLPKQQQSRFSFLMPAPKRVAETKEDFCLNLCGSKTFQGLSTST